MPGSNYRNITTAATTQVKGRSGILKRITVNTTAAGAITVYDSTTGAGSTIATFPISATVGTYDYNARFLNGLTIVTAAASDITVIYE